MSALYSPFSSSFLLLAEPHVMEVMRLGGVSKFLPLLGSTDRVVRCHVILCLDAMIQQGKYINNICLLLSQLCSTKRELVVMTNIHPARDQVGLHSKLRAGIIDSQETCKYTK